jgi:uncharacterized protein
MIRLFAALWLALVAAPVAAQTFPKLTGRVVDSANLLDPPREQALTARLEGLEQQSGRQLVVATVPSLEGRPIEDYGYRLGRAWGIGSAERDDGVVLLVAPNERKVRIETGYGARVFLTDAMSSYIVRNAVLPRFRQNDYPGGIEAGVEQIATQMTLPPAEAQKRLQEVGQREGQRQSAGSGIGPVIFWGMIILFVLLSFGRSAGGRKYRGRGRRRNGFDAGDAAVILWGLDALSRGSRGGGGWGGGFGGGGGGGFGGFSGGGGSFGGGGASGSW